MTCEPKIPTVSFLSKIWKYWTDVHFRIVKMEAGGQQLPVIKKYCSGNRFNLEKSFFFIKSTKTYVFTQITFVLSRIKMKSVFSIINKRKISAYPIQPEKIIFLSKITKIQLFDLKCAILNRYSYESHESRNIEMINSEGIKNLRNS